MSDLQADAAPATAETPAGRPGSPGRPARAWLIPVFAGLVIGTVFVAVYVGLQRHPTPHRLPVAVAGQPLASAVRTGLGASAALTEVADAAEGARRVHAGDVIGSLSLGPGGALELDYAGAAGASESGAVQAVARGFGARTGRDVRAVDIVPLVGDDSRGLSGFYVVFGVTLASFVLAQALTGAADDIPLRDRLLAIGGFAVVIGLISSVLAGPVYGSLPAPYPELALTLVLLSTASAFATKALGTWLGPPGIGLAVLLLTTIGNATSGAIIGVHLLPAWARTVSPVLPPGAAVRALTRFGYLDGTRTVVPLLVLAAWSVAGSALVVLRSARTRPRVPSRSIPSRGPRRV
ncbi:hypothetical protein CLV35_0336 [Motilibacter peucedani]|uniref:ABC-type multidrug transport system permease subunit n=1 Tax=Motilibacter peucedani TaxID=598650 RepID=A0A420XT39_9ACTN|nr:hypothetical protein [Motilibacter peucedani]RKS79921.1 hypothetical protein CLV35_0336 [Motilibacter peucedani]